MGQWKILVAGDENEAIRRLLEVVPEAEVIDSGTGYIAIPGGYVLIRKDGALMSLQVTSPNAEAIAQKFKDAHPDAEIEEIAASQPNPQL